MPARAASGELAATIPYLVVTIDRPVTGSGLAPAPSGDVEAVADGEEDTGAGSEQLTAAAATHAASSSDLSGRRWRVTRREPQGRRDGTSIEAIRFVEEETKRPRRQGRGGVIMMCAPGVPENINQGAPGAGVVGSPVDSGVA